jgi:SSS family solute:Na+ symporter
VSHGVDRVALAVFAVLFLVVTVIGFLAARWRKAADLMHLDEWGLGGRSFGTFITWFLLGGDLYTAYTFIAVPALVFGAGALGFFAVPYTVIVYPIIFVFLPRLWSVSHRHGYVTPADFVRGRFDSRALALAVAVTGILATMPYIALQLVGIQVVLATMGLSGDLPLIVAFAILAAYTYSSGLRAPALIAFVKDGLIYLVIAVAIVYIPTQVGGWAHIFTAASQKLASVNPKTGKPFGSLAIAPTGRWAYGSLALGSALALFMYPHCITAVLSTKDRNVVRRNAAMLPAYSLVLGLIALLGYMAVAAGVKPAGGNAQLAIPELFNTMFPSWFAGVAFAAVGIGALVPAAIMAIAAANLFTRNVYREFLRPSATPAEEAHVSKVVSLVVKFGALVFVLGLDKSFAINLQLLGGIWILQTFPAIVFGLYTRWFHRHALLAGWAVAMIYGTKVAYGVPVPGKPNSHFGGPTAMVGLVHSKVYIALTAFVLNIVVVIVLTAVFRAVKLPAGTDATVVDDYQADAGDVRVQELPELLDLAEAPATAAGEEAGRPTSPGRSPA